MDIYLVCAVKEPDESPFDITSFDRADDANKFLEHVQNVYPNSYLYLSKLYEYREDAE